MARLRRIVLCFLSAVVAFPAVAPQKPKLVLAIVIDQFRYDYLLRFRSSYNSGLERMMEHGAFFTDAHYLHSLTVTAVGHSTFLSGATPSVSGIISNDWFDRESGKTVTSVSDASTKLLGGAPDAAGSSPRRLLVSTLGDEIKMQGTDSKVIGVSIKDRSAILPSGHMADGAFWVDAKSNQWVSSSYYGPELPAWVKAVNDADPAGRYRTAEWRPLGAKPDAKPFCTMAEGAAIRNCGSLEATPWGNEMIEEFAERALAAERLGQHRGVDLLTVSFSSNDYVGHAVGPDDPEVRDMAIRTDRLIGKLLDDVDRRLGAGNTLVVLTADHGVAPVPEVNQARHMPGGRIDAAEFMRRISDALAKRFGPGKWVIGGSAVTPYLNLELIHSHNLDPAEVENVAAAAARSEAHIARVYTRHQIVSGQVQNDPMSRAVSLGFFAPRSGDLYVVQEPFYLFDRSGTSHGTPYNYDTHVPVIFFGPRIKPGEYRERIAVNDIAPTLAALLGVQEPSGSAGRVLTEMLQ